MAEIQERMKDDPRDKKKVNVTDALAVAQGEVQHIFEKQEHLRKWKWNKKNTTCYRRGIFQLNQKKLFAPCLMILRDPSIEWPHFLSAVPNSKGGVGAFGAQLPMIRDHSLDSLGSEDPNPRDSFRQNYHPLRRRPQEECLLFGRSGGRRYR